MININEKIYKSYCNVKYVLKHYSSNCKYLMIIFSAFSPYGIPPCYSYFKTFDNVHVNKLYILDDYGPRGCYYLGKNRSFDFEKSAINLIKYILTTYHFKKQNVICAGSSKGGYSSLYYGMKYGFSYIISGAPQSKIGSYMIHQSPNAINCAKFIAGGTKPCDEIYLNNLIFNIIKNTSIVSKIYIHVGKGDFHYKNHVIPLIKTFDEYKIKYNLDAKNYSSHNDTSIYYPNYLMTTINDLMCTEK